jgi:FixJ family two-component response regulator
MRDGALEFLVKPVKQSQLRRALSSAIGTSRMRTCRRESVEEVARRVETLTPTEWRVAQFIAQGYVTKQIANILGRSENTTKIHRFRIFTKLGVSSAASLVKIVEMAGTVRPRDL